MQNRLNHVLPPRGNEIEIRVIAALTHIGDPLDLKVQQAMLLLDEQCFHNGDNRQLFCIIRDLFLNSQEFSFVTFMSLVPDELYNLVHNLVSEQYINTSYLPTDVNKLIQYRGLRNQLRILVDATNHGLDALTPEAALTVISEELQKITQSTSTTRKAYLRSYETIADDFLSADYVENSEFKVDIEGLPPVPEQAMITIAGRSGHGKTFLALYLMDKIIDAKPGKQSLYFNLEMHERVMMDRHAILVGAKGDNRRDRIKNVVHKLLPKNVSLISEPMITIEEIETECRLAALRQPLAVIVVDYLGLIRTKVKGDRHDLDQVTIAKRLAALTLELDCNLILLTQVNRDFKSRPIGDRCPRTEDAAESMGSVHSSFWWIGIDQPQADTDDPEWANMFILQNRKNRGEGGLFKIIMKFQGGRFYKWQKPFCSTYVKAREESPAF